MGGEIEGSDFMGAVEEEIEGWEEAVRGGLQEWD